MEHTAGPSDSPRVSGFRAHGEQEQQPLAPSDKVERPLQRSRLTEDVPAAQDGQPFHLLELPVGCLAVVVGQLDTAGMLGLFSTSHTTRRLVLSHARCVKLRLAVGARAGVMARLLEVPADQPCFPSLMLRGHQDLEAQQLALLIQLLQPGRIQELELMGCDIGGPQAAGLAAACSVLRKLTLRSLIIQEAPFFTALATACTQLRGLVLRSVNISTAAQQSLGQLGAGLPALQQFKVRDMGTSAFAPHPQLLQRITYVKTDYVPRAAWLVLLVKQAASFQQLRTLTLPSGRMDLFSLRALCACPSLTHVAVSEVLPPSDGSVSTLDSLPPALQQLSLTHVRMQDLIKHPWIHRVPELKMECLQLPGTCERLPDEERLELTQQLRQAAALLASVPSLVFGDPSKKGALQRSFSLSPWPAEEELSVTCMGALQALAPRLGCLALALTAPLSVSMVGEMGRVLGSHTHILCLTSVNKKCCISEQKVLEGLFVALPLLEVLYLGLGGPADEVKFMLHHLASVCKAAHRQIELQVPKTKISDAQAAAVAGEGVQVVLI